MKVVWSRGMCPPVWPRTQSSILFPCAQLGLQMFGWLCAVMSGTSSAASLGFLSTEWLSVNGVNFLSIQKFPGNKLSLFCLLTSWKILFCLKTILFKEWYFMQQKNLVQPALEANFSSAVCLGSREAVVSVLSSIRTKCIENVHYIV